MTVILLFSILAVIIGFIHGYLMSEDKVFFPDHSKGMAIGIFTTSFITLNLFNFYAKT